LGEAWSAMTDLQELQKRQCSNCRFFNNNPADLEGSMVGLRVMGSGHSSVVSNDGICENLDRYLSGRYSCDLYEDKA